MNSYRIFGFNNSFITILDFFFLYIIYVFFYFLIFFFLNFNNYFLNAKANGKFYGSQYFFLYINKIKLKIFIKIKKKTKTKMKKLLGMWSDYANIFLKKKIYK